MNKSWIRITALLITAGATNATAHEFAAGALTIKHPWSRPTAQGSPMGVAYFTIANHGQKPDTLMSARTPAAEKVELHRTVIEDGMARMRPAGEIVIEPGATVKAEPGGLHLMLVGLKQPLVEGTMVPLLLTFSSAGEVTVQLKVEARAAAADPHAGH